MFDRVTVQNVNSLSTFLAAYEPPPPINTPHCAFLLAGSAILHTCTALFDYLSLWDTSATLIIAGGLGHSTSLLYEAVAKHPRFAELAPGLAGLAEARVIEGILQRYWPELSERFKDGRLTLLVDDKSTNCSENTIFAQQLLNEHGIQPTTITLVQDPTMSIRTAAGLCKNYSGTVITWPTFVPLLRHLPDESFAWSEHTLECVEAAPRDRTAGLWAQQRFVDLLLGEIPRLRQYGPDGQGDIVEVRIPPEVLAADAALRQTLKGHR